MAGEVLGIGVLSIFFIFFFLIIPVLAILALVFWVFMLVDAATREYKNDNDKVVWVLIVALLNFLGAAIYYFVIKVPDKH